VSHIFSTAHSLYGSTQHARLDARRGASARPRAAALTQTRAARSLFLCLRALFSNHMEVCARFV
jgi:hypothetical protein